jgi:hypothetical protein
MDGRKVAGSSIGWWARPYLAQFRRVSTGFVLGSQKLKGFKKTADGWRKSWVSIGRNYVRDTILIAQNNRVKNFSVWKRDQKEHARAVEKSRATGERMGGWGKAFLWKEFYLSASGIARGEMTEALVNYDLTGRLKAFLAGEREQIWSAIRS